MGVRRLIAILAFMCMAAACREAHLDGSSEATFHASVMSLNREHTVEEAQAFGTQLQAAEAKLGADKVRQLMNGMGYMQAKAFLAKATEGQPASIK